MTILFLTMIFLFVFLLAFIAWRVIWFRQFGGKSSSLRQGLIIFQHLFIANFVVVEIPVDKNFNIQELNQRKIFCKTKTFDVFVKFFREIVGKLEMDYWVTHCGTDGYLYLLFQRRFLKLLFMFSLISICVSVPVNVTSAVAETYEDWFEKTTLNNKELSSFKSWMHVILVLSFTVLTIRTI